MSGRYVRAFARERIFLAVFLILFGLGFGAGGTVVLVGQFGSKARCTVEVQSVVSEMKEHVSHDKGHSSYTYSPVFFYEYNGQKYKRQSSVASDPPEYSEGQQVTLKINPDDPTEIYVPDENTGWVLGFVFAGAGAAIFIGGAAVLIYTIHQGRKARQQSRPMTVEDELQQYQNSDSYTNYDDIFK